MDLYQAGVECNKLKLVIAGLNDRIELLESFKYGKDEDKLNRLIGLYLIDLHFIKGYLLSLNEEDPETEPRGLVV
jgi:hypothetical protein